MLDLAEAAAVTAGGDSWQGDCNISNTQGYCSHHTPPTSPSTININTFHLHDCRLWNVLTLCLLLALGPRFVLIVARDDDNGPPLEPLEWPHLTFLCVRVNVRLHKGRGRLKWVVDFFYYFGVNLVLRPKFTSTTPLIGTGM